MQKYTRFSGITAKKKKKKKISEKYKIVTQKRNIDAAEEIRQAVSEKNSHIAAKKILNKYKKMRCKKTPNTFLVNEEDFKKQFITIMTLMKACFKKKYQHRS